MRSLHESMFSIFKFLLVYLLFVEDYGAVEIHGQPLAYNFSVSLQFLSGISFGSWQRKLNYIGSKFDFVFGKGFVGLLQIAV